MTPSPELFEISNHAGLLVAAGRDGLNVKLFACGPKDRVAVGIAPAEARELAAALVRFADAADESERVTL
jgi:hypothetical protein